MAPPPPGLRGATGRGIDGRRPPGVGGGPLDMKKLDGKVVVVTGASRGIGAEIARLFAAEGGRVICAARTLREGDHQLAGALEPTVADIRAGGGEAQTVAVHVAESAESVRIGRTPAPAESRRRPSPSTSPTPPSASG